MKKNSSYIDSLISELHSCEFANEILAKYQKFSADPILKQLFETLSLRESQLLYSSDALTIISSSLIKLELKDSYASTYIDNYIDRLIPRRELGLPQSPIVQDSSLSTLWSQSSGRSKSQKTLRQLSSDVKNYIALRGHCTYKEVADEIVKNEDSVNENNIRRRVYDAINVLTAAEIFEKRGKQVCIVERNCEKIRSLKQKKERLKKLTVKYQKLEGILWRNSNYPNYRQAVQLPFWIVLAKKNVFAR